MTSTTDPQGATEDAPRAKRRWTRRLPIWVRVSVIVAVVLVGVLFSTMLLAAGGDDRGDSDGGHRSGSGMEMNDDGSGGDGGSTGDHGSGRDRGSMDDHGSGGDQDPGGGHGSGGGTG